MEGLSNSENTWQPFCLKTKLSISFLDVFLAICFQNSCRVHRVLDSILNLQSRQSDQWKLWQQRCGVHAVHICLREFRDSVNLFIYFTHAQKVFGWYWRKLMVCVVRANGILIVCH